MSTVETLSIKNIKSELPLSLRGSLAANYQKLTEQGLFSDAQHYLENLCSTNNPDLLRYPDGEFIVIGLESERGKYFPDW